MAGKFFNRGFALTLGLAAAGCSSLDTDNIRAPRLSEVLSLPSMSAPAAVGPHTPVKPVDLVNSEGQCAEVPMASAAPAVEGAAADPVTMPPNAALASSGIGLGMTECDVVRRAGAPEKMEQGTNERAERTLTLTYLRGIRPGIYSFAAGRLVSIERAPEPPAPPKPVRPAKPAKPRAKPAAT